MDSGPLMKSELFVINCVQSSELARSAVAELIPGRDAHDLLKVLQNPDKLRQAATNARVKYEEMFERLAQVIFSAFGRRAPVRLTRDHVRRLLNSDIQYALAEALGCAHDSALQTLFSVSALRATLDSYASGQPLALQADASKLLGELLRIDRAQTLELDYNTTANDWEPIFEGEQWLSPDAERALAETATVVGGRTSCSVLAELINQTEESKRDPSKFDLRTSDTLGPLGLRELRRRLAWIYESLTKEIIEGAEKVAASMPGSPSVQLSLPVLQIYELGNVAQGLRDYINHTHPLRALIPEKTTTVYEVDMENVVYDSPLVFSAKELYEVAGNQVGTFEILCALRDQSRPQVILSATDVKAWVYQQLSHDIPRLTPDDLSFVGKKLYDHLLNTPFPVLESQTRILKEAVNELGAKFVRAAALSCEILIDDTPELLSSEFTKPLPYQDLPRKTDPIYPRGIEDIIAMHKETYGDSLRIERGTAS